MSFSFCPFDDAVVKKVPDTDCPTLGSDPTARPGNEGLGEVKPKDISDGKSLWHAKGSKS